MPTGKDALNHKGLQKAARKARDPHARVHAAAEAFRSQIIRSEAFAKQLDELVMGEDSKAIVALIAEELELPDEVEVSVLEIDAGRWVTVRMCAFRICVTMTVEW